MASVSVKKLVLVNGGKTEIVQSTVIVPCITNKHSENRKKIKNARNWSDKSPFESIAYTIKERKSVKGNVSAASFPLGTKIVFLLVFYLLS